MFDLLFWFSVCFWKLWHVLEPWNEWSPSTHFNFLLAILIFAANPFQLIAEGESWRRRLLRLVSMILRRLPSGASNRIKRENCEEGLKWVGGGCGFGRSGLGEGILLLVGRCSSVPPEDVYWTKQKLGVVHTIYLTIVQRVKKSFGFEKTLQPFQADGWETPSNSWDDSNPTPLGCPLDEENEYWLKRYGHKRWFPKYVDQSGAPGHQQGGGLDLVGGVGGVGYHLS